MELWHVVNRSVHGQDLFLEDGDYLRFIHDMYEFNDSASADSNTGHRFQNTDIVSPYLMRSSERIVEIHGWCLMKNHYHLLISEVVENGLSLFMRKLNIGYAKSFNEKPNRAGTLFQGRTKKILIGNDAHFNYILHYIHLNPLDYLAGGELWRVRSHEGIADAPAALKYLHEYRWSSYRDYAGTKNFPSILTQSLFNGSHEYQSSLRKYLHDSAADLAPLHLE